MQLGLENKKKATWAAVLGAVAVLTFAYEVIPMLTTPSTPESSAQAAAPLSCRPSYQPSVFSEVAAWPPRLLTTES